MREVFNFIFTQSRFYERKTSANVQDFKKYKAICFSQGGEVEAEEDFM